MRKRLVSIITVLLILGISALIASWPPRVNLRTLETDQIPEAFRSAMADMTSLGSNPENVVWRTFQPGTDSSVATCTATISLPDGRHQAYYIFRTRGKDVVGSGGIIKENQLFFGGASGAPMGAALMHADGMALDARIAIIIGRTKSGASVETRPVNGFWWIDFVPDVPQDDWVQVTASDRKGHVLYNLLDPR